MILTFFGALKESWQSILVFIACSSFVSGCVTLGDELELTSHDPAQDQRLIGERYGEEAMRFHQKAEEAEARAEIYANLFGIDSDWVKGTRLLAESYRDTARQRESLAAEHLKLVGRDASLVRSNDHSVNGKE